MAKAMPEQSNLKEQPLPGTQEREIEDLVKAADTCLEKKLEAKRATDAFTLSKSILQAAMRRHQRTFFSYRGMMYCKTVLGVPPARSDSLTTPLGLRSFLLFPPPLRVIRSPARQRDSFRPYGASLVSAMRRPLRVQ